MSPAKFLAVGRLAARCADDKKADRVSLMDVRKVSSVSDYVVLASAESQPQLQAIYSHIVDTVKESHGLFPLHRDGIGSPQWAVVDYGGVLIHLFHRNARDFYSLERLWEGAKPIAWEPKPAPAKRPARARPGKPARGIAKRR